MQEAGGTVRIIGDWRGDEERLVGGAFRQPHVLFHPAALDGLILMLITPAGIGAFQQIHQAFTLLRLVAVVVYADDVAEVVEGDLLGVADAVGVDFEVRPIGFAAQYGSAMREIELSAFLARDVAALVSHGPINAAVRAEAQAVHVMTGVGDVPTEAGRDDFLHVRYAVAIGVLEAPDVRDGGHVDPAIEIEDTRGDTRDRGVEALGEERHLVGDAVMVRVTELVDGLLVEGEILPVDRAVFVVVLQAASRRLHLPGGEFALVEGKFLRGRREADVIRDPHPMFADVEVADLSTRCRGHVGVASFVERDRSRIRYVKLARPLERLHLCAEYGD